MMDRVSRVPEVLIVGHDASRTGAPAVAATFARWAERTKRAAVRSIVLRGGPLARSSAWPGLSTPGRATTVLARSGRAEVHALRLARAAHAFERPPVVVANTVAAWAAAAQIRRRARLVCWVHELDGVADAILTPSERARLSTVTDRFVAVDPSVAAMLTQRWGIDPDRVVVVPPFADAPPGGAPTGDLQVLGAGSLVPRKGADLFVSVLAQLRSSQPATTLRAGGAAWVGGPIAHPFADLVRADLEAAGLGPVVRLAGPQPSLEPWWPAKGLLLHAPREDPAPLVVLEAAMRGVPTVTWATGGAGTFLEAAGAGDLVVDAGDVVAMADRAAALLAAPERRAELGEQVRIAASERSTDRVAPRLLADLIGRETA